MADKHMCKSCGFLTLWGEAIKGEARALNWQERESGVAEDVVGQWPETVPADPQEYHPSQFESNMRQHWPHCFVSAMDLEMDMYFGDRAPAPHDYDVYGDASYNQAGGDGASIQHKLMASELASRFRAVAQKDRTKCTEFFAWFPGFTPKEHVEMQLRERQQEFQAKLQQELLQRQQVFQADEARKTEVWQQQQEERVESRHQSQMKQTGDIHRNEMATIGRNVTIAIIVAMVVGAAIEAGWIPKWFGLFP